VLFAWWHFDRTRIFLSAAAQLLERSSSQPVYKNTWGDALYFVFETVEEATAYALDLRDQIRDQDWTAAGLPAEMNLRISLHTGPVYSCWDPVIQRNTIAGFHVNRAARIEPVTPPGRVYASEACAALLSCSSDNYICEYVGQITLPKKMGPLPMYHVFRAQE